ncbi:uncharacterized protein LY89DRAFT_266121 [Mollisia scopiformis]|uniref:Uncharacterized protein n=1 Tax=Mollisia scopiformis TaxID=149040 RepID=A0A132BBV7_MOLSC|nr:uncharacterized protein LY89DRAFT_266121 [Mollisia scopiformis]KUJ09912.1 hypothetical protein LY89DRAFT_266121 [Mollisia scopiformis]
MQILNNQYDADRDTDYLYSLSHPSSPAHINFNHHSHLTTTFIFFSSIFNLSTTSFILSYFLHMHTHIHKYKKNPTTISHIDMCNHDCVPARTRARKRAASTKQTKSRSKLYIEQGI